METVESISLAGTKGLPLEKVASSINKTRAYAKRCLAVAVQLKMVRVENDQYVAETDACDISQMRKEDYPLLFRKFLQKYTPFLLFISLLNKGKSLEEACRKVKIIYDIASDQRIVKKSLIGWAKYAGLLAVSRNGNVELKISTNKKEPKYLSALIESLDSDIKIRLYLEKKLTDEVFGYLQQDEVEFFIKALKEHSNDPRGSIEDAGKAFEDFLRRIGRNAKVDLSTANGIGQCSQLLKGKDVIMQKHLDICNYINTLRLASAHSKDKKTMIQWKINPDTALETILITLTALRSIFLFVFKKKQIM